jgi:hypothetical protein
MLKSTDKVITHKQHKAVIALLTERTARDAARVAGVSEKTLYAWLGDDTFRAALRCAEGELLDSAVRRLANGQGAALDAIETLIAKAKHESTKLSACVQWLNLFMKYRDMKDIDERLTALEAAVYDTGK